jgi:hypothetical protein
LPIRTPLKNKGTPPPPGGRKIPFISLLGEKYEKGKKKGETEKEKGKKLNVKDKCKAFRLNAKWRKIKAKRWDKSK